MSKTSDFSEIEAIRAAQAASADLHKRSNLYRDEHARLISHRRHVADAPPPPDEVVANMRRLVDEQAATRQRDIARQAVYSMGGSLRVTPSRTEKVVKPALLRLHDLDVMHFDDLCGLVPELVKAGLEAIIRAHEYVSGGPLADRQAELAVIDADIAEIERSHTALVEAAASLEPAIIIPLLATVRQRREHEQSQRAYAREIEPGMPKSMWPRSG